MLNNVAITLLSFCYIIYILTTTWSMIPTTKQTPYDSKLYVLSTLNLLIQPTQQYLKFDFFHISVKYSCHENFV